MADLDDDDRNPDIADPWQDYTGYTDADGMYVITHIDSAGEWIAADTTRDRRDIR